MLPTSPSGGTLWCGAGQGVEGCRSEDGGPLDRHGAEEGMEGKTARKMLLKTSLWIFCGRCLLGVLEWSWSTCFDEGLKRCSQKTGLLQHVITHANCRARFPSGELCFWRIGCGHVVDPLLGHLAKAVIEFQSMLRSQWFGPRVSVWINELRSTTSTSKFRWRLFFYNKNSMKASWIFNLKNLQLETLKVYIPEAPTKDWTTFFVEHPKKLVHKSRRF